MRGTVQFQRDPHLEEIPVGVLLYLVVVPLFWMLPKRRERGGINGTRIIFAIVTWKQPLWRLIMATFIGYGYLVISLCRRLAPEIHDDSSSPPASPQPANSAQATSTRSSRTAVAFAWIALLGWFIPTMLWAWVAWCPSTPKLRDTWTAWVNVCGPAYLFLRLVHLSIDVARGKIARVGFVDYLTWVLFVPTMRLGPVIRFQEFIPQLETWRERLNLRNALTGLLRIVIGLVRLVLVVKAGAYLVPEAAWQDPATLSRLWVLATAMFVAFTLYLWTSGVADVAIGLSRMMGFVIPENFTGPWLATSVREYWKRYHNTMSSILFEYIYVPLGGNRKHVFINYLVTFVFCGLWHDFRWNQPLWGLSQAVGLYVNRRWHLYWTAQREAKTHRYEALRRCGLAGGRLSLGLSWLLTTLYQIFTFTIMLDPKFPVRRWVGFLLGF